MTKFADRHKWDLGSWPEMYDILKQLQATVFMSPPGIELNMMVFTVASVSSRSSHCQAHSSRALDGFGVPLEKVKALWSFQSSDLFDDRERAALQFATASSSVPNGVDASHHAALRSHFTDEESRTILATVAVGAFMNRYNDSLATVTDQISVDWAEENLKDLGWNLGRHAGAKNEQRTGPPGS